MPASPNANEQSPLQDRVNLSGDQTRCLVEARRKYLAAVERLKQKQLSLLGPLQVCSTPNAVSFARQEFLWQLSANWCLCCPVAVSLACTAYCNFVRTCITWNRNSRAIARRGMASSRVRGTFSVLDKCMPEEIGNPWT